MSTYRRWTSDEEQVVISKVKANPNNLTKAFREASLELNRSVGTIVQLWYTARPKKTSTKRQMWSLFYDLWL